MRCWYGYLFAARCRLFAYGPADATAIPKPHHMLSHFNRLLLSFWYRLTQVVLGKRPLNGCSVVVSFDVGHCTFILLYITTSNHFITARCYASAVLTMGLCLSVSVRLSQAGVLLKRQNVGSHKQHYTIRQGL